MVNAENPEHTEFPRAGSRARRWSRFERDLYSWMNRPEGQFECWMAKRKLGTHQGAASRQEPHSPLTTT